MRYFILFFLFFVFSLWGGEPEKADTPKVEAPKVEIPSNVKAFLDTYDKQMNVEKQKYLNLVLKMQKDLKGKLENEIKTAERNKKDDLVVVLTEKKKQLEENTVEDNFVTLGFPGEVKKMNKKMMEDILSSQCWALGKKPRLETCWVFKSGRINPYHKATRLKEANGTTKEVLEIRKGDSWEYFIDVEKQVLFLPWQSEVFTYSISENKLTCIASKSGRSLQSLEDMVFTPHTDLDLFLKEIPNLPRK